MAFVSNRTIVVDLSVSTVVDINFENIVAEGANSGYMEIISPEDDILVSLSEESQASFEVIGEVQEASAIIGKGYVPFSTSNKTLTITPLNSTDGLVFINFGTFRN